MTQTRTRTRPAGERKPPRLEPSSSVKLTGRGAIIVLFGACFIGLLFSDWTGWTAVADAIFLLGCGVVAYYTRAKGLRNVVVSPPLAFLAATVCTSLITAPGSLIAAEDVLVTLGTSAPWLFTGTALTFAIAFGRGYRPQIPAPSEMPVIGSLIEAVRELLAPRSRRKDRWVRRRLAWFPA